LLEEAIADYDAALRINPKLPLALFGRGMANLMNGNATASIASIEAAKLLKPSIAEEFAHYGVKWPEQ
jgi:tetratricopeptide (TPR) repeat protein